MSDLPTGFYDQAINDEFDFMLKTKSGDIFRFRSAKQFRDDGITWLQLSGIICEGRGDTMIAGYEGNDQPVFERGVDIRRDEIEWVCAAPFGS